MEVGPGLLSPQPFNFITFRHFSITLVRPRGLTSAATQEKDQWEREQEHPRECMEDINRGQDARLKIDHAVKDTQCPGRGYLKIRGVGC